MCMNSQQRKEQRTELGPAGIDLAHLVCTPRCVPPVGHHCGTEQKQKKSAVHLREKSLKLFAILPVPPLSPCYLVMADKGTKTLIKREMK